MYLECTCADISIRQWEKLMHRARKCSYKRLIGKIKQELPEIYDGLALQFYNPYSEDTRQTETHYILVHSAIEYFFRKETSNDA